MFGKGVISMKLKSKLVTGVALMLSMMLAVPTASAYSGVSTIKGSNRVETSIRTSDLVDSNIVVVASAYSFADSLSAFNIASKNNAKLLLVSNGTDLTKKMGEIKPNKVYLIGGPSSIGGRAVESINNSVSQVIRLGGQNRYETNQMTLDEAQFKSVGVADGRNYPDALAASCLLKDKGLGLKLVNGANAYKTDQSVVYTFGGKNSVKQNGGKRISGSNRYKTSEAINSELGGNIEKVAITTGEDFADALSAINVVNSGGKVSLVLANGLSKNQENFIGKIGKKIIIGGKLPSSTVSKIAGNSKVGDIKSSSKKERNAIGCVLVDISGGRYRDDNGNIQIGDKSLSEISKHVPKGYKIVSNRSEVENLKENGDSNTIFIAKEDSIVLRNQKEYDRFIYNGLKNGLDTGTIVVAEGVKPNKTLERIVDGMGFTLDENLRSGNNGFNVMEIRMSIRQEYFTKEKYSKDEYINQLSKVEELIKDSGVRKLKTNEQKAKTFARYLKVKYPFNNNMHDHLRARSPYCITRYGIGVCEGFTYTFNQAMLLLNIPAVQMEGTDKNGIGHMESGIYYNGKWNILNISGYTNWDELDHDDLDQITDRDIESVLVNIANDFDSTGLRNRIKRDIESFYRL